MDYKVVHPKIIGREMMKYQIDFDTGQVAGPFLDQPSSTSTIVSLSSFIEKASDNTIFNSGLLPVSKSGILSIQKGFGYEQIILQKEPAIETVRWGKSESQKNKPIYRLAMPWQIVILDYHNSTFVGARLFYSPEAIHSWSQPLYVAGVPNLNCKRYNGTSVGWLCLYHTDDTTTFDLAKRIDYGMMRVSGLSEPYNDYNMSETDGPRFYAEHIPDHIFSSPTKWQTKSLKDGFEWVLNPSKLIALKTDHPGPNNHNEAYLATGIPYTLDRAANEAYSAYYHDLVYIKPFMLGYNKIPLELLATLFTGGVPVITQPKPKIVLDTPVDFIKFFRDTSPPSIYITASLSKRLRGTPYQQCAVCSKQCKESELKKVFSETDGMGGINTGRTLDWCESCIGLHSAFISGTGFVHKELCSWSPVEKKFFLPKDIAKSDCCGTSYHKYSLDHFYIYTGDKELFGCAACVQDWVVRTAREHFSNRLYIAQDNLMLFNLKKLIKVGEKLQIVGVNVWIHISREPCRCGLIVMDKDSTVVHEERKTCQSCIVDGKYTPFVDFESIPPPITTAQLAQQP